jgi:hypothetical protein
MEVVFFFFFCCCCCRFFFFFTGAHKTQFHSWSRMKSKSTATAASSRAYLKIGYFTWQQNKSKAKTKRNSFNESGDSQTSPWEYSRQNFSTIQAPTSPTLLPLPHLVWLRCCFLCLGLSLKHNKTRVLTLSFLCCGNPHLHQNANKLY